MTGSAFIINGVPNPAEVHFTRSSDGLRLTATARVVSVDTVSVPGTNYTFGLEEIFPEQPWQYSVAMWWIEFNRALAHDNGNEYALRFPFGLAEDDIGQISIGDMKVRLCKIKAIQHPVGVIPAMMAIKTFPFTPGL